MGSAVYVALVPPAWARKHLGVEGGEPAEDLHLTLAYLGKAAAMSAEQMTALEGLLADFASRRRGLKVNVEGVGRFDASIASRGRDVVWREVKAEGLVEMRAELVATLQAAGFAVATAPPFVPHMTVGYVEPGKGLEVAAKSIGCRMDKLWLFSAGEPRAFALAGLAVSGPRRETPDWVETPAV